MRQWSERAVARWLGVSHAYVQKLVRKFQAEPDRMRRIQADSGPATFQQLNDARESTRQAKERVSSLAETLEACQVPGRHHTAREWVLTKAEERRRSAEAQGRAVGPVDLPINKLPLWARGICREFTGTSWDSGAALQTRDARKTEATARAIRSPLAQGQAVVKPIRANVESSVQKGARAACDLD